MMNHVVKHVMIFFDLSSGETMQTFNYVFVRWRNMKNNVLQLKCIQMFSNVFDHVQKHEKTFTDFNIAFENIR